MPATVMICAGSQWNTVGRAAAASTSQVVMSDNSTLFPPSYLYDYLVSHAARFNTTSSAYIRVDCNITVNGGMETAATSAAGVLASWVVDSGTVVQSSSQAASGTYSMKLGAGPGVAHEDILTNAGERFTFTAAMFGDGVNAARLQVQNLQTFSYLTSSGGWQSSQAYCLSSNVAAWTTASVVATVEALSPSVFNDTMTLRIQASNSTGTVYVDNVFYWPSTSLVALFGFLNIDPGIVVKVISSTDNFTTNTTETTMTHYVPSMFYAPTSPIDKRYVAVTFSGVNSTRSGAAYGGELALAQPVTLTRTFDPALPIDFADEQARPTTVIGGQFAYRLSSHPVRQVTLPYTFTALAEYQQVRDIVRRSGMGATPVLVIPSSTNAEVCVLGRLEEKWTAVEGPMVNFWSGSKLTITELPFPTWVS